MAETIQARELPALTKPLESQSGHHDKGSHLFLSQGRARPGTDPYREVLSAETGSGA